MYNFRNPTPGKANVCRVNAIEYRRTAHWWFRAGYPNAGKEWAGRAVREWQWFKQIRKQLGQ